MSDQAGIQHGPALDDDDDHLDGCEIDFAEHAQTDEERDFAALFPPDQSDEEREDLVETLKFLEELDA